MEKNVKSKNPKIYTQVLATTAKQLADAYNGHILAGCLVKAASVKAQVYLQAVFTL